MQRDGQELLERQHELATIRAAIESAAAGSGRLIVVEAPAGLGKSSLLAAAAYAARAAGIPVFEARASELEQTFPFGVALQLLEARVSGADDAERAALFSGAAALAAPVFGPTDGAPDGSDPGFSLIHGLYWLLTNLAESEPLVVLIDDAQWADAPSLRFIQYAARRVTDLPVLVVTSVRTGEPGADEALAGQLEAEPDATVLRPAPLSGGATAALVADRAPGATPAFCEACHDVTRGNPFLLRELLREWRASGNQPDDAAAARVGRVAPDTVALAALAQIARLPDRSMALARAASVLGDGATLSHAARVADVSLDDGARMADALRAAEIFAPGGDVVEFAHPLIRTAVYQDIPDAERATAHLSAARMLLDEGREADRAAPHLLVSPRQGEAWVVNILRQAAARAVDRGAPDSAASLLRRALDEPPERGERAVLLTELGKAESAAGEPGFAARFEEAVELVEDPGERGEVLFLLGRRLYATGRFRDAAESFDRGLASLDGTSPDLRGRLEAGFVAAGRLDVETRPRALARLEELRRRAPGAGNVMERVVAGSVAFELAVAGGPGEEVADLARRALHGDLLLSQAGADGMAFYSACAALGYVDELEEAEAILEGALDRARRVGSAPMFARASAFRAFVLYRQGRIDDAIADATSALDAARDGIDAGGPALNAVLGEAQLDRGDADAARTALELDGEEHWQGTAPWAYYLHLRGRLRLLDGDAAGALDDFLACGELLDRLHAHSPSLVPWRAAAALAASRMGEKDQAARHADEAVAGARAAGVRRALGIALRSQGLVEERVDLLEEAVGVLEPSPARLELARALVDLGAAVRREGRRTEAREPLRRALDLAHRCGAGGVAEHARDELLAAGGRPRRVELSGREALTPSERRVARMAADGLTNRQIAEALFVTVKTVQYHLGNVYRKVGVDSRERLSVVLDGGEVV